MRTGFAVRLAEGVYEIRTRSPAGKILEGSEKRLVVYDRRREGRVGLEVIPGDRWTRPAESHTPSSIIYVDGSADLYLQPFYQDEYNDLYHRKTVSADAEGNASLHRWIRVGQIPDGTIEVTRDGAGSATAITEEPFFVRQVEGAALGYTIEPFDGTQADEPSLQAYHLRVRQEDQRIQIRVKDENGEYLSGGWREIRIISDKTDKPALLVAALVPIVAYIAALFLRRRVTG
jgi:hypothetical protein